MQTKLQELTEQLYNEGLAKGRQEGDRYLEEARLKSSAILEEARARAAGIIEAAEKEAADLRSQAEADRKMGSVQAIKAKRKDTAKTCGRKTP